MLRPPRGVYSAVAGQTSSARSTGQTKELEPKLPWPKDLLELPSPVPSLPPSLLSTAGTVAAGGTARWAVAGLTKGAIRATSAALEGLPTPAPASAAEKPSRTAAATPPPLPPRSGQRPLVSARWSGRKSSGSAASRKICALGTVAVGDDPVRPGPAVAGAAPAEAAGAAASPTAATNAAGAQATAATVSAPPSGTSAAAGSPPPSKGTESTLGGSHLGAAVEADVGEGAASAATPAPTAATATTSAAAPHTEGALADEEGLLPAKMTAER
mmetsp:Transcript_5608/g.21196  ORF Transcript_5608/g.21196 Transcript_5608/m.21196 type:complete len:271 (-) Transcript_5608:93-905(-)